MPDGKRIVTASKDGTARLWDATDGKPLAVLAGHSESVFSAAYSPDGKRIVTTSRDGTARLWDATDGKALTVLEGHSRLDTTCDACSASAMLPACPRRFLLSTLLPFDCADIT